MRIRPGVVVSCCVAVAGCGGGDGDAPAPSKSPARVAPVSRDEARALGLTWKRPAAYRRVCKEQAAYAPEGARACLPLIPEGPVRVSTAAPFGERGRYRGGYSADFTSASVGEIGHWRYDVAWTRTVRRLVVLAGVRRPVNATRTSACRRERLGAEPVRACRVVPFEHGGGINGGHLAYIWTHGRVGYVVSVHGYANRPLARAMTQALIHRVLRASNR